MKILVYIAHFFDVNGQFVGKSKTQDPFIRKNNLLKCISAYENLNHEVDIKICGIGTKNLIPIDIDFENNLIDPRLLIYEILSIIHKIDNYDFIIVSEDDILINSNSIDRIIDFSKKHPINFVYHPHRIEYQKNKIVSIDIALLPGKTGKYLVYDSKKLAEYMNPHAGFLMLSKEQINYASKNININLRDKIFGGFMASAFYNYLKPFVLYRDLKLPFKNYNIHLDTILFQPSWKNKIKRILVFILENIFLIEYGKIFPPYKG